MPSRWRKMRLRARYARNLRHAAKGLYKAGDLSESDYREVCRKTYEPETMDNLIRQSIRGEGLLGEFDWANLWEWIQENLIPLLQMLLPVLIMFLDSNEDVEDEDEPESTDEDYKIW